MYVCRLLAPQNFLLSRTSSELLISENDLLCVEWDIRPDTSTCRSFASGTTKLAPLQQF